VRHIRDLLAPGSLVEFTPPETEDWRKTGNVAALGSIERHARSILEFLRQVPRQPICNLGGDCGGELSVVAFLNEACAGRLQVVWLDAHADLNTPESSPSGNFHGMVLRTLCGEGPPALAQLVTQPLDPRRIVFAGLRSIDPDEARFIASHGIPAAGSPGAIPALLNAADPLYVHVDYDVLDGRRHIHSACPEPGGLSLRDLVQAITLLRGGFHLAGISLTEYAPIGDGDAAAIRTLLDALGASLPRYIVTTIFPTPSE
jgi:arginase